MITAFQALYKKHFDENISDEQALDEGMQLVLFIQYMNLQLDDMVKLKSKYV